MKGAIKNPRLVVANLRPRGPAPYGWVRLCPAWYMTGMPAKWTTTEAKLREAAR